MTPLIVEAEGRRYAVHVGDGLLGRLGELLKEAGLTGRVAIVSDDHVLALWKKEALDGLERAGFTPEVLAVRPGEEHKTLGAAEPLYGELIRVGLGRHDAVVALGGGVVGDLAGFVAATYHRGMPLVQVPTTLLSQVDSSIGGKVAVDHPLGKNLVGAFHPPKLVVADTATLATLPKRERWSGLAEVVKAALIADGTFVAELERELEPFGEGALPKERVAQLVRRAAAIKVGVVSRDDREQGERMLLNFGHTLGHALETATGYGPLTHGEAVVLGMRAAVRLSARLGTLAAADAARALALLARFPKPPGQVPRPSATEIASAMARDKKAVGGRLRFILLAGLGRARVEAGVDSQLVEEAVEQMLAEL